MLHLLGMEGPRTKEPAKYIRYIYNRVILENATVRAAAVSSLAQFGALVAELRPRIQVLLKRALHDNDDEVVPPLTQSYPAPYKLSGPLSLPTPMTVSVIGFKPQILASIEVCLPRIAVASTC